MNYYNYRDVTSAYSLDSRKFPGRFSYGLGMRLAMHMPELKFYHCSQKAGMAVGQVVKSFNC